EEAIRQAELLGASPGWVRMLNGHLAFHQSKIPEALQELDQATQLMPDSVAAKAMLVSTYIFTGQYDRADELLNEVKRLEPASPEDFLFKGEAVGIWDPIRGLQILDAAVDRRDSVLARLIRTFLRGQLACQTGDPAEAERAVEDAFVARSLLGSN